MIKAREWIDRIMTWISSIMIGVMMIILFCNVVLRYIPGIGGFKWYMESSQYLNVWAMLIIGIQISVRGTHLHVEVLDSMVQKHPVGKKLVKIITSLFIILFYVLGAYSGYELATRAKQVVSTMPQFTMGQVYFMIPITFILCALAAIIDMLISVSGKEEGGTNP